MLDIRMNKPIIVFDFDGVIHSYKSGWKGVDVIPDKPVPGVKEFIKKIRDNYQVYVLSSRTSSRNGVNAVEKYLKENDIEYDRVVSTKPPAVLTIDDRCICFDGNFDNLEFKIKHFESWVKKGD
jgi:hypothetical protein